MIVSVSSAEYFCAEECLYCHSFYLWLQVESEQLASAPPIVAFAKGNNIEIPCQQPNIVSANWQRTENLRVYVSAELINEFAKIDIHTTSGTGMSCSGQLSNSSIKRARRLDEALMNSWQTKNINAWIKWKDHTSMASCLCHLIWRHRDLLLL